MEIKVLTNVTFCACHYHDNSPQPPASVPMKVKRPLPPALPWSDHCSMFLCPLLDVFMVARHALDSSVQPSCHLKKKNIKKCFKISTMLVIIQENLIMSLKVRDKSLNYLVQTIFDWVLFFVPLEITESHLRHNFQLQKLIKTVGAGQTAAVTRCALHLTTPISRQHLYDILSSCLLIHIHISLNLSSII